MKNIKKRLRTHYLYLTVFTAISILIFRLFREKPDLIVFITDVSGYISIFLLAVTLLIGPVNLILKRRNPISTYFRRDVGIYGGILAVIHSVVGLFAHLRGKPWLYFFEEVEDTWVVRFDDFGWANHTGLIATILVVLLLLISNNYFLKKLKGNKWKNLQRLSYIMFSFAIVHSIYYRSVIRDNTIIDSIYVFLFLIVLIFQLIGIRISLRNKKDSN